jgi:stress response protein SCP2
MTQLLQAGGNQSIGTFSGTFIISHDIDPRHDINLTAFLLTEAGKVQGDSGIVFFNQPREPNGAAIFIAPVESGNTKTHRIDFNLRKIPAGISKIAVTLTEDNRNTFATVKNLKAEIRVANQSLQLVPNGFSSENGIIVSELYIRNEQPKVRAVWQGFASGLDGLCVHYGVEVTEETNDNSSNSSQSSISESSLELLERLQTFLGVETSTEKRARLERVRLLKEEIARQEEAARQQATERRRAKLERVQKFLGFETSTEKRARLEREEIARQQEIVAREAEQRERDAQERQRKEQRRANLRAKYGDKGNQLDAMVDRYGGRFESLIDKYNGNIDVLTKIMNRELWVGQTKMQLLDSKGNPADKDQKVMATKTRETWKYHQVGANRFRLKITLENDVVVAWEEK